MSSHTEPLVWPVEAALAAGETHQAKVSAELSVPKSNIALDLHGDPLRAHAVVFSDGNHHMALEETLSCFLRDNPDARDILYVTTPPRIVIDALKFGRINVGNLSLTISPHVFIGPDDVLDKLNKSGFVESHKPFMRSAGLSILLAKGNPRMIQNPTDLLSDRVRLAISYQVCRPV